MYMDVMVPALDIEEILDTRPWEENENEPSPEQIETLEEGVAFLTLVLRGQRIKRPVDESGVIDGDLSALRAYDLLADAGRSSQIEIDADLGVIEDTIAILRTLIVEKSLPDDDETESKINSARELFLSLVNFGIVLV